MKWAVVVMRWTYRVLGGQGVGQKGPRGLRGWPTGSQGVKGWAYMIPGGQQCGLMGLMFFIGHIYLYK